MLLTWNRIFRNRLTLHSLLILGFLVYLCQGCYDAGAPTHPTIHRRFKGSDGSSNVHPHLRHRHRHRHLRRHRNYHNFEVRRVKKRCRYSEPDIEQDRSYASKIDDTYNRQYKQIKHHQIRDQGQGKPFYHHGPKIIDQPEIESIFVSVGDTVNLTCNIAIPEVDWHFKDTNLTTTILSYGTQLLVNQAIIYNSDHLKGMLGSEHFHDMQYPSLEEEILKYRLSSDMQAKHQLTLYIEGNKDEGSYQCVDSKSEQPVKKTIHVILKANSGALMSGFDRAKLSNILFLFISLFPLINNFIF